MKSKLEKYYFQQNVLRFNIHLLASMYCDIRVHTTRHTETQLIAARKYLADLSEKITQHEATSSTTCTTTDVSYDVPMEISGLEVFGSVVVASDAATNPVNIHAEMTRFEREKGNIVNPLTWWKANHFDYPVARIVLCIPASSSPSERLVSKAGLTITQKRTRLAAENAACSFF